MELRPSAFLDPAVTLDPTTTLASFERGDIETPPTAPSMNDDIEACDMGEEHKALAMCEQAAAVPAWPCPPSPRAQRRRAQAQPVRLHASGVLCYPYLQGSRVLSAAAEDGRWQGRTAHLHYFLPENWSPSYKFTVFEDSYVLSFARAADEPWPPTAYHLARPLHGVQAPEGGAPALPEFELVWPVELDPALLESIEATCDRVVPGAKRKPQEPQPLSLHNVHLKLQKLDL